MRLDGTRSLVEIEGCNCKDVQRGSNETRVRTRCRGREASLWRTPDRVSGVARGGRPENEDPDLGIRQFEPIVRLAGERGAGGC